MMHLSLTLLIWLTVLFKLSESSSYWHPNQTSYVGDYHKKENINEIDFCDKEICIIDADRMALWMNETANPCDNFYKYACGSLLYYVKSRVVSKILSLLLFPFLFQQALNERYFFQGFQQILYEIIAEQRRKVLSALIEKSDIRPHVIAKAMFQKCVDSREFLVMLQMKSK